MKLAYLFQKQSRFAVPEGGVGEPSNPFRLLALAAMLILTLGAIPGMGTVDAQEVEPQAVIQTVNINEADATALAAGLNGVGPSKAEAIVRYRETYGPFKTVDELVDVKGIGNATLNKNRAVITLE